MVTDRQTDRQTYAGDSIILRESFRRDNENVFDCHGLRGSSTMLTAIGLVNVRRRISTPPQIITGDITQHHVDIQTM